MSRRKFLEATHLTPTHLIPSRISTKFRLKMSKVLNKLRFQVANKVRRASVLQRKPNQTQFHVLHKKNNKKNKRKRSSSPNEKPIKRIAWSKEEIEKVQELYQDHLLRGTFIMRNK
ncbi:uncharacterized protein LOC117167804 [Belonocnema kinseyi]|uniref:uncharacterized protein LOC117167804 n=1 Tax=Belonocnema kinseyi TaxID=2817044 RepID=UPI00143CF9ED|nr:uncharacterized protein LOC117167804 [Belonocnema kinseyi]